jgi:hypothetical protein
MSYIPPAASTPTTITDINIPFGRLVMIMVKFMFASIPALILFYAFIFIIMMLFMLVFGGGAALLQHLVPQH